MAVTIRDAEEAAEIQRLKKKYISSVEFVGVVLKVNGEEITRRVAAPVKVDSTDMLEIELADGLFIRMSRDRDKAFGTKSSYPITFEDQRPRAERRRDEREQRKLRLITLE